MKKRTKIVWIIACIGVLLGVIAGIALTRMLGTRYPDAAAQANGVYMEWLEEPTRENLVFRIVNTSDNTVYGGSEYWLEYSFLGGWYSLPSWLMTSMTFDMDLLCVEGHTDDRTMREEPHMRFDPLPAGKYRIVKRFHTVEDFVLYENRNEYIDLYLEFELD